MSSYDHPMVIRFINYYKKLKQVKIFYTDYGYTVALSLITAPLHTISIAMQLSVKPHLKLYPDYTSNTKDSKALIKQVSEMTVRDSRNYNLIKSSGVPEGQKPYRAPIYNSYRECINALQKQGILGFYKGNGIRMVAYGAINRGRITLDWFFRDRYQFKEHNIVKVFLVYTIIDILAHPLFVMESRFILQNRLPNFRVFPSIIKYKSRSKDELFVNILCQIPKNVTIILSNFVFFSKPNLYSLLINNIITNVFIYPILTCMRRLVCQSGAFPGMLPYRYLNLLHALSLIKREEGVFKGLYKGFSAHILAVLIWTYIVPVYARLTYIRKMEEDEDLFENDEVFKEIQRKKLSDLQKKI